MINAEETLREVHDWLAAVGFTSRDADPTDLQRGSDTRLRFKIGTSRGEVAIQVMVRNTRQEVLRIISTDSGNVAYSRMANYINVYSPDGGPSL